MYNLIKIQNKISRGEKMNPQAYKLQYTKLKDSKVFRDAIHNYIHVDQPVILELINSKEMQRLRRIKQLGGFIRVQNIQDFVIH